jgi:hypothetical protein
VRLLAAGCLGLAACEAHVEVEKVKETTMAQDTSPKDPFEGVFPPAWKVGDRWRVTMKTEDMNARYAARRWTGPSFVDVVFDFRVLELPASDGGVFLVDVECKPERLHFLGKYRKTPFSFVRLEDERGKSVSMTDETNPPLPYLGQPWDKFIKAFPAMPWTPHLGITPFVFDKAPAAQEIERTADGLRFTISATYVRVVITWKRGAPWWSSVEQTAFGIPVLPPQLLGSGALLGT